MNLSGVFSYGNLLKTFLPGLLLLCGFILLADSYILYDPGQSTKRLAEELMKTPTISIAFIASGSIFLGIISNSVHFKWTIPFLGKMFERKNQDFIDFKKAVFLEIDGHYAKLLSISEKYQPIGKYGFDARAFLLNRTDVVVLQYLRESYWYYMEFQINSIGASIILSIALTIYAAVNFQAGNINYVSFVLILVVLCLFTTLIVVVFFKAACENYEKHEKKYFSFVLGTYHICRYGNTK